MKQCKLHHSAMAKGYRRVKDGELKLPYDGKFGKGYVIHYPTLNYCGGRASSNGFHIIEYYIEKEV